MFDFLFLKCYNKKYNNNKKVGMFFDYDGHNNKLIKDLIYTDFDDGDKVYKFFCEHKDFVNTCLPCEMDDGEFTLLEMNGLI